MTTMIPAEISTKTKWVIDKSHSEVGFKIRHLMISHVKGMFREFEGSIYTTGQDFMTAEIDFWLNASSIDTGDATRDEHLKANDFFDVEHHKQISFSGNTIERGTTADRYVFYGELTMKGITKQIKLDVEFGGVMKDPFGNHKAGFSVKGVIYRLDWGLTWNSPLEAGGIALSNDVVINCEIQLTRQA